MRIQTRCKTWNNKLCDLLVSHRKNLSSFVGFGLYPLKHGESGTDSVGARAKTAPQPELIQGLRLRGRQIQLNTDFLDLTQPNLQK